jgi:hypothetical protein
MKSRVPLSILIALFALAGLTLPLWSTTNVSETLTANYHRFKLVTSTPGQEVDSHELGCGGQPGVLCWAQRTGNPTSPPPSGFWQLWSTAAGAFLQGPTGGPQAIPGSGGSGGSPPVSVLVRLASNVNVAHATDFVIPWPAPLEQKGGTWWTAGQPTRLTPPVAGTYVQMCGAQFLSNATGYRQIVIKLNGLFTQPKFNNQAITGGTNTKVQTFGGGDRVVGDYFENSVWQNSGGALALTGGPDTFCFIWKTT